MARVQARRRFLRDGKRRFRAVSIQHGIWLKSAAAAPCCWHYAVAPVAPPGKSKHGLGYAIDISGNGRTILSICGGLGASLVFDEKSHVHVEFSGDVKSPSTSSTPGTDAMLPGFRKALEEKVDAWVKANPGMFEELEAMEDWLSNEDFVAEADRISFLATT